MLARIRKAQEEHEGGFTLIELLVVIIIIGILAAIAIPVFLNQRKKAVDASMKSDLRTVANAEETYFVDNQAYIAGSGTTTLSIFGSGQDVHLSPNNTLTVTVPARSNATGTYCVVAHNTNGTQDWVYISDLGGLQPSSVQACK
jgi:type IV pilus assembly protein PilA